MSHLNPITIAVSVGAMLVGLLFPNRSRTKPEDLAGMKIAGPTPGTVLPILHGTDKLRGHVIWNGPFTAHEAGGKKGGGGAKKGGGGETTYTVSFAHALAEGDPNNVLLKIWNGDDVIWDAADPAPGLASGIDFTFYPGTQDQAPDPRMAAFQAGGGGSGQTQVFSETASIPATGGTFTAGRIPILSGTDSVFAQPSGGSILVLTRVASSPGLNQYTVDLTTGLFTIGSLAQTSTVTFRYSVASGTSVQEPLGYPNVCYLYVHELNTGATQTIPQYTYEVRRGPSVAAPDAWKFGGTGGFLNHVWVTPDDGLTWDNSVEGDPVADDSGFVSWDPAVAGRCYKIRLSNRTVYRSDSYGAAGSWVAQGIAVPEAVDGISHMLIMSNGELVVPVNANGAHPARVYISGDAGATWTAYSIDATNGTDVRDYQLWESPAIPGTLFCVVISGSSFVYRSLDYGRTWSLVLTVTPGAPIQFIDDLFVALDGTVLLSEGFHGSGGVQRIRRSLDGTTWTVEATFSIDISDLNRHQRTRFSENYSTGRLIFAGKYYSDDGGDNWTLLSNPPFAGVPSTSGQTRGSVFASEDVAGSGNTWRSPDGGAIWQSSGSPAVFISDQLLGAGVAGDVDPVEVIVDYATHKRYGAGLESSLFNAPARAATTAYTVPNDLLISSVVEQATGLLGLIEQIMAHYFGTLTAVQGQFVLGARREETVTREIVVEDALVDRELTFALAGERDTKNRLRIEWSDRSRRYNSAIYPIGDDFDVVATGERAETVSLPYFKTASRAQRVGAKYFYLRSVPPLAFEATLGPKEIAFAPGDMVALTSAKQGLAQEPCRIAAIGESGDRGEFAVQFVAEPAAALALHTFPVQPAQPGDAPPPATEDVGQTLLAVWEVPAELSGDGVVRTMFIGAGTGHPNWRGFSVYMSLDGGVSYLRVATYLGASGVIGAFEGGLVAGESPWQDREAVGVTVAPSLGQLTARTRNQALALDSLALVRGAEPFAYRDADLVAANRYTLRGFFRGPFEQGRGSIAASDLFAFVGALPQFPTVDHPASRVGQALWFKAVSVDRFGREGDQAAAPAVSLTLQGIARRPSPIYGLQILQNGVAQGSKTVIGTGELDVAVGWRYARRDQPYDFAGGNNPTAKEPLFLDYAVWVWTKATAGASYGLRRTAFPTTESYAYTAAMNNADNGAYHPFVRLEVSARRTNGVESLSKLLDVRVVQ